jgi:hypothetical protein
MYCYDVNVIIDTRLSTMKYIVLVLTESVSIFDFVVIKKNELFYLSAIPPGAKGEECMDFIFKDLVTFEKSMVLPFGSDHIPTSFFGGMHSHEGIMALYDNTVF